MMYHSCIYLMYDFMLCKSFPVYEICDNLMANSVVNVAPLTPGRAALLWILKVSQFQLSFVDL